MGITQNLSSKPCLSLVLGLVIALSVPASAHAQLKINPYPQGIQAIKKAEPRKPYDPNKVFTTKTPPPVLKAEEPAEEIVPLKATGRDMFGDASDHSLPSVQALADRPRRFTDPDLKIYSEEDLPALPKPGEASDESVRGPLRNVERVTSGRMAALQRIRPNYEWNALAGASIKETLDIWSRKAGVEMIWDGSYSAFEVLETATINGSFEDAVRQLLDQYKRNFVRPVGRLFVNPQNEGRVLVVEITQGV